MSIIPPPPKPYTPGLDFASRRYVDPAAQFDHECSEALHVIKAKLQDFAELEALISITLSDGTFSKPPVYIDARGGHVGVLDETDAVPDAQTTLKPGYVIRFHQGILDPRLGLFMDAAANPKTVPTGNVPKIIRWADLLNKTPVQLLRGADSFDRLPQPTEDLEQVKRDIEEFGYGLIANALLPAEVAIIRDAVMSQAAGEQAAGVATFDGGPDKPNQRVWNLINKGDEFIDLLNHPLIDAIVPWFLGEHAHISTYTANIARPGNVPMIVHTDQAAKTPPQRHLALGLNISFYLVDTEDVNGATRMWPGSHVGNVAPCDIWSIDGSIPSAAPAGTAVIFDNRLWHTTGPNRADPAATNADRPVILLHFVRSYVRAGENHYLSMRKEVQDKLPDRQRAFFGFRKIPGGGSVDGGTKVEFVSRIENAVGRLRV
ncbi:hypothetical protein M0657_006262 [Pyricularia oryzae]|nr:hypothetical protein M0657_006262 [Pyricularia oryzae]KAI7921147.1 hypothetical protein M9X92_005557 [Pyricularia oryzae]